MSVIPIGDVKIPKRLRADENFETFMNLLREGVTELGLETISSHFMVTKESLEEWMEGQHPPLPIVRRAYIAELKLLLKQP